MTTDLKGNGRTVNFAIDICDDITVLTKQTCADLGLKLESAECILVIIDGSKTNVF